MALTISCICLMTLSSLVAADVYPPYYPKVYGPPATSYGVPIHPIKEPQFDYYQPSPIATSFAYGIPQEDPIIPDVAEHIYKPAPVYGIPNLPGTTHKPISVAYDFAIEDPKPTPIRPVYGVPVVQTPKPVVHDEIVTVPHQEYGIPNVEIQKPKPISVVYDVAVEDPTPKPIKPVYGLPEIQTPKPVLYDELEAPHHVYGVPNAEKPEPVKVVYDYVVEEPKPAPVHQVYGVPKPATSEQFFDIPVVHFEYGVPKEIPRLYAPYP